MRTAPLSSMHRAVLMIKLVRRTIPLSFGEATDSAIMLRWERPIFLPERIVKEAEIVTTPRPPAWTRSRMMTCPNSDQ